MTSVLVVDDDTTVTDVVSRYLRREGLAVESVGDGGAALERAAQHAPDLVVLDLMLPGMNGVEVCRRLRELAPIPVIMLTARGEEEDRIMGLNLGADDYITKPFSPGELTARVKALLRRANGSLSPGTRGEPVLSFGALRADLSAHEVTLRGEPVSLTVKEFDLLVFLMRHPRAVFSRNELFEAVWGYTQGDTSTVMVHVRRLREKVEADPSRPCRISTVWGVGYRFDP